MPKAGAVPAAWTEERPEDERQVRRNGGRGKTCRKEEREEERHELCEDERHNERQRRSATRQSTAFSRVGNTS